MRGKYFTHPHPSFHCSYMAFCTFSQYIIMKTVFWYQGIESSSSSSSWLFYFLVWIKLRKVAWTILTMWFFYPKPFESEFLIWCPKILDTWVAVSYQKGSLLCTVSIQVRKVTLMCYCYRRPYFSVTRYPNNVLYRKKDPVQNYTLHLVFMSL